LGYQNRLTGNAPQAQAVDVTKSSLREADDTQGIQIKLTRAMHSKQTLPKAAIFIGEHHCQNRERVIDFTHGFAIWLLVLVALQAVKASL
jgi:hypothetical protein